MKIIKAKIYPINLPMKISFTTGFGTLNSREAVIVKLVSREGIIGYGEAPALSAPIYNPETSLTCIHLIRDFLLTRLLNRDLTIEEYVSEINSIRGNRLAKHGVECALWGIRSQLEGKPLKIIIGGTRSKVPVGESIGIQKTVMETVKIIESKLAKGYRRMKVKIKPGWDLKLIKGIRKEFPNLPLMVDANSSYCLKDIKVPQELDQYSLMMIEQPLADDDIIDHAKIQAKIKTPICLDESITSAEDARKAIEIGACKIINVKPPRVGGILESIKINQFAKENQIPLWCGGMIETAVGKHYNLAVASLSEFSLPADMSPTADFFREDIAGPEISISQDGTIEVPGIIGPGFEIIENNLKEFTISSCEVTNGY